MLIGSLGNEMLGLENLAVWGRDGNISVNGESISVYRDKVLDFHGY